MSLIDRYPQMCHMYYDSFEVIWTFYKRRSHGACHKICSSQGLGHSTIQVVHELSLEKFGSYLSLRHALLPFRTIKGSRSFPFPLSTLWQKTDHKELSVWSKSWSSSELPLLFKTMLKYKSCKYTSPRGRDVGVQRVYHFRPTPKKMKHCTQEQRECFHEH